MGKPFKPTITAVGRPNFQRFGETLAALIAAKEGLEIVPGTVRVTLKKGWWGSDEPKAGLHPADEGGAW